MTELDFAELDKAVNDLMKDGTSVKRPTGLTTQSQRSDADKASAVSGVDTETPNNAESVTVVSRPPEPSNEGTSEEAGRATVSSLATKRRGRFMDVVHPSGDMKMTRAPKREGFNIQPTTVAVGETEAQPKEDVPPVSTVGDSDEPQDENGINQFSPDIEKDLSHLDSPKSEYPDPITMSFNHEDTSSLVAKADETTPEGASPADTVESFTFLSSPKDEGDLKPTLEMKTEETLEAKDESPSDSEGRTDQESIQPDLPPLTDEQPLVSPFLPNTKVEKRPLGGASSEEDEILEKEPAEPLPANDLQHNEISEESAAPLPAELSGAVMAVESAPVSHDPEPTNDTPQPTEKKETPMVGMRSERSAPLTSGNGSIAQQYTEQPSTSDQSNGSIYDTKTYHQPLDHPAKKKSGVGVIIWILTLMIIGALAGTAYFYFTTR